MTITNRWLLRLLGFKLASAGPMSASMSLRLWGSVVISRLSQFAGLAIALVYFIGASAVFLAHVIAVPNVTLALIVARSALWPIYVAFGWPHGTPIILD